MRKASRYKRVNFKPNDLQLLGRRRNVARHPTETKHLGGSNPVQTEWSRPARSAALAALQVTRPLLMLKDKTILSHNPKRCPLVTLEKLLQRTFSFVERTCNDFRPAVI